MPSKKKPSKAQSRLNGGDRPASPSTLSGGRSSVSEAAATEDDLFAAIVEASERFPHLIGKSAIIGRVSDVESESTKAWKGCKIWMSELSMVASSIAPGSIVSVSLPSSRNHCSPASLLSSFADECCQNTGVFVGYGAENGPGDYFALATVFPSSKISGNGVKLSLNLSLTMGCPDLGRAVFVFPVQSPEPVSLLNRTGGVCRSKSDRWQLPFQNCTELCLELASTSEFAMRSNSSLPVKPSSRKDLNSPSNGYPSSPKTPTNGSRMASPSTPLSSQANEEFGLSSTKPIGSGIDSVVDSVDIIGMLDDYTTRMLLQTRMTSLLYSRIFLKGNLAVCPILSKRFIFRVVSDNPTSADIVDQKSLSLLPDIGDSFKSTIHPSVVTRETKLLLSSPMNIASKPLQVRGISHQEAGCKYGGAKIIDDKLELGGLSKEYSILMDIITSSCVENSSMSSFGLRNTKGVLLHGPPGTGKTTLAQLCSRDACINFFSVNGPEIISQYYGESEQALCEVFESASQAAPSVIFIDELDAIAPARKEGGEGLSQRMVATLLTLMDGITGSAGVLIISATNRPDSVEPALRRPGRFDREIEIGVPSPKQRLEILLSCLSHMEHALSDAQIQQLAVSTHGFVGADLAALCNEAALSCLRRYDNLRKSSEEFYSKQLVESVVSDGILEDNTVVAPSSPSYRRVGEEEDQNEDGMRPSVVSLVKEEFMFRIDFGDFESARMKVRPSAMREVILEVPKVKWEDIGGQKEAKNQLLEAVEWPQKHQDALDRIGTRPPRGVLLFGPPGCSKTLMARAVASEAGLNFLAVKGPELFSKWVGESEKAVRSVFAKARANAPSIIFFDEIDGLGGIRGKENDGVSVSDRVMSQLLVELDGLHQRVGVTVIAATNRPDKIDSALLRPGRFDRLLYVGPPNKNDREEIFRIHLGRTPCSSDVCFKELANLTEGFTGADISLICREAALTALEDDLHTSEVTMEHLKTAIDQVEPSEVESFQELSSKFQRLVHSTAKTDH